MRCFLTFLYSFPALPLLSGDGTPFLSDGGLVSRRGDGGGGNIVVETPLRVLVRLRALTARVGDDGTRVHHAGLLGVLHCCSWI